MTALHGGWAGDLVLIIAVAVLVVGFLVVYAWTRRPPGDRAADTSAPPTMDRPLTEPPAPTSMSPEPYRAAEPRPWGPEPATWATEPPSWAFQSPAQPPPVPPLSAQPLSAQPLSAQPLSAQPLSGQPLSSAQASELRLERRHPLPPDAAFSLAEPS